MKKLLPLLLTLLLLTGCAERYDGPTEAKTVRSGETHCGYNSDGSVSYSTRTEYAYDTYGNRVQYLEFTNDKLTGKFRIEYDEAGNVRKETHYSRPLWLPDYSWEYTYDAQGRKTSETHRDGFEVYTTTYTYDDAARTQTTTYSDGSHYKVWLDEAGNATRSERTIAGQDAILTQWERSDDGRTMTTQSYRNGQLISSDEYTYDDQGRMLTWCVTEDGVTTVNYGYEYGETYEKCTYDFGSYAITNFAPDGTAIDRLHYSADGTLESRTVYHYTEIQVPAKEGSP
ncbi:MAG: hypothetical protein E7451_07540 [Ruminococcaceae bacterium]|nr:hypothetical protein [Oscillospiraceae bacterium]